MPPDYSLMRSRWLLVWIGAFIALAVNLPHLIPPDSVWSTTAEDLLYYAVFGVWAICQYRKVHLTPGTLLGSFPHKASDWRKLLLAFPLMISAVGLFWLMWYPLSFPFPEFTENHILQGWPPHWDSEAPLNSLVEIAMTVAVAPIIEEIVYRGLLLYRWALKWGPWCALTLSSTMFGFMHDDVLGAIVFGFVMGFVAVRTCGLWIPIALHSFYNAITIALEYTPEWLGVFSEVEQFRDAWPYGAAFLFLGVVLLYFARREYWPDTPFTLPRPSSQGDPSHSAVAV